MILDVFWLGALLIIYVEIPNTSGRSVHFIVIHVEMYLDIPTWLSNSAVCTSIIGPDAVDLARQRVFDLPFAVARLGLSAPALSFSNPSAATLSNRADLQPRQLLSMMTTKCKIPLKLQVKRKH